MVEEEKLSINEISLSRVAEQYIAYLKSLEEMPKEELAAFLVIASTLMLIKSRSLIPGIKLTEEEEQDIKELERRLKTYKFFKGLSLHLKDLNLQQRHLFGREAYAGMSAVFFPPEKLTPKKIKDILDEILLAVPVKEALPEESMLKTVSLEEKMAELKRRLEEFMQFNFDEFRKQHKEKLEIIISFLAMLELIKQGFMIFEQKKLFGSIELKKHERAF
ncbi:MAG: Segregation and condensation protein A [Candidatus Azambacteria bacterium GW2011_GWC2_45_7b]|uniref:Segregation and condensation protein A n=2 Tax=Parcubacteria group TaxID=1794811 RepID=A0A837IG20_9BACT|nr:MAG: Chromosome segregation and condensation protein ScpA [Parcubacteria group bacterium GW2011_GWC1_44_10]KKT60024.1 MAG: Segregation and condensation protein A [Candidatus Giovannonibacteria bacterium GW2011_GWA1_44_25]KKU12058.1 MAG: Segregation and condensation protein A [Candidatus Azambacteria bacterium GW2011_GWC2_45_7b]KKU30142.1 MAG: Segregation and condensation protein A [Candidatus Giovannonibacteria bacterium GW2011_GWB1_46_20]